MCEIELCNGVKIGCSDCSTWGNPDTRSIFLYFSDTFREKLSIPFSEGFEFFREEPVFVDISPCERSSVEEICSFYNRRVFRGLEIYFYSFSCSSYEFSRIISEKRERKNPNSREDAIASSYHRRYMEPVPSFALCECIEF